jgi:hypothetical protein
VQPLPLTLRPSPVRMGLLLFGAVSFVAGGIWLIPHSPLIAAANIFFFGLCAIVFAITLHPRSSFLTVASDGFTFASLFRKHFVPWSHVQSFAPIRIGLNKMVGWNYVPEFREHAKLRRTSVAVSGMEAGLPNTYGMTAESLSALLNEVRQRHGKSAP